MKTIIIKGASGLGDAIYLMPIVDYLKQENNVIVKTKFPELYDCETLPFFHPTAETINCNYCPRKNLTHTKQFEDMCYLAKIPVIDFTIKWEADKLVIRNKWINSNKKVVIISGNYIPMNGATRALPLQVTEHFFTDLIKKMDKEKYIFVQIGKDAKQIPGVDLYLKDQTSVRDIVDLFYISDQVITQTGFGLAIAEALNKKCLVIFTDRALKSQDKFISSITPAKVIHKSTTSYLVEV